LAFTRRRVAAEYAPAGETYEGDPFRTHCPGPTSADASDGGRPLASGSVPLRAFGGKRVVISLDRGSTFATGAYAGRTEAALTISLRRVSVRGESFRLSALRHARGRTASAASLRPSS